jgi:hypothetical protein
LRLLNNITHEIKQKTQHLYDLMELLISQKGDLFFCDKFNVAERQLRIVDAEASRLIREMSSLDHFLSPHTFDDMEAPKASGGNEVKEAATT